MTHDLGEWEAPKWAPPTLMSSVRRFALGSLPACLVFAALSTGILYRNGGMRLTEAINRFPLRVVLMLSLFFLGSALTSSVLGGSAIHVACGIMAKADASGRRPRLNVWLAVAVGTAAIGGLLGFLACTWTEWVFESIYLKDSAPYYGLALLAAAAGSYLSARHYNEPEA